MNRLLTGAQVERGVVDVWKQLRNARVQERYDELMKRGKHGHYETLFKVVREEVELDRKLQAALAKLP